MFDFNQLDEVNNAVAQVGISDKRKRNEAIRSGMENPGVYKDLGGYQPSEFLGAGRKLASNQNPDSALADLFRGSLGNTNEGWQYYGDTDYSLAQLGTNNYKTTDSGDGTYDIFGTGENKIGTGYYDPGKAAAQLGATQINSGRENPATGVPYPGLPGIFTVPSVLGQGTIQDWEVLGGALNDTPTRGVGTVGRYLMPSTGSAESISGAQSLYGSSPVLYGDSLLGYLMDLTPGNNFNTPISGKDTKQAWNGMDQGTGTSISSLRNVSGGGVPATSTVAQLWREYNSPDSWGQYGRNLGDGNFFVSPENSQLLPGWTNKEYGTHATGKDAPWYNQIVNALPAMIGNATGNPLMGTIAGTTLNSLFTGSSKDMPRASFMDRDTDLQRTDSSAYLAKDTPIASENALEGLLSQMTPTMQIVGDRKESDMGISPQQNRNIGRRV